MVRRAGHTLPRHAPAEKEYWLWSTQDEHGKRRKTRYRMTEETALERYGPSAKRLEWSMEKYAAVGNTSDFLKRSSS